MSLKNIGKVIITGNTYPSKDKIRKMGGRWDSSRSAWIIDIAGHPQNTMRGRGPLALAIRDLEKSSCRVEYD
jgi:hypothetical protein